MDISKDLRMLGCPVCHHLGEKTLNLLFQWQCAVEEEPAQQSFAADGGLCSLHTWQLFSVASIYGLSIAYPKLIERVMEDLAGLIQIPDSIVNEDCIFVPMPGTCQICRTLETTEHKYTRDLADYLNREGSRQTYADSRGVCLRHLRMLVAAVPSAETKKFLISEATRRFTEYRNDMQSYAIKHKALRRDIITPNEKNACLLAIIHLVGEKSVCAPWDQGEI